MELFVALLLMTPCIALYHFCLYKGDVNLPILELSCSAARQIGGAKSMVNKEQIHGTLFHPNRGQDYPVNLLQQFNNQIVRGGGLVKEMVNSAGSIQQALGGVFSLERIRIINERNTFWINDVPRCNIYHAGSVYSLELDTNGRIF